MLYIMHVSLVMQVMLGIQVMRVMHKFYVMHGMQVMPVMQPRFRFKNDFLHFILISVQISRPTTDNES